MIRKYVKKVLRRFVSNNYRPLNYIELDRRQLLQNVLHVQKQHPGYEVVPVLKGNAYGHGIAAISDILRDSSCTLLAVDGYFEALKLRESTNCRILVMGHILPVNVSMLDIKRCSFVVQDSDGLHAFGALNRPVRIHLELNTGMNRLGLQPDELASYLRVLKKYPKLILEGVMTHLADADNEIDETETEKQLLLFDNQVANILTAGFQPTLIHIAQTAGSVKTKSRYANAIRLGIGAYGINPLSSRDRHYSDLAALRPVLELKSTIVKVLELKKGDAVSYNGTFIAPGPMRIGVLPLGYYEGLPRELSNRGCVTYKNKELPIVGRICMDHTMIDLKDMGLQVNDEVTVISKEPSSPNAVAKLQTKHGQFAYVTLVKLSSSIRRKIV